MITRAIPRPEQRMLAPNEAARRLGITPDTLGEWARAGKIESLRDPGGHRRLYASADVEALRDTLIAAAEPEPTLHDDLRAVEAEWPHWHCFISSEGRLWAVTAHYHYATGSGMTVDAGHVSQLGHAIAEAVHTWELVAA